MTRIKITIFCYGVAVGLLIGTFTFPVRTAGDPGPKVVTIVTTR